MNFVLIKKKNVYDQILHKILHGTGGGSFKETAEKECAEKNFNIDAFWIINDCQGGRDTTTPID